MLVVCIRHSRERRRGKSLVTSYVSQSLSQPLRSFFSVCLLLCPLTIEQGKWKRTIDHYCIIVYEHIMLVAGVFLSEKLKTCPIMFQNRTTMTLSPNTWAYIKLNTILMRLFKIKCCCSGWNN